MGRKGDGESTLVGRHPDLERSGVSVSEACLLAKRVRKNIRHSVSGGDTRRGRWGDKGKRVRS